MRPIADKNVILVTGGAGFIGSNFVRYWLAERGGRIINLDKLTYAGHKANLADIWGDERHMFVQGDIGDRERVGKLLSNFKPHAIVNFAAESHVDRSIHAPEDFVQTNVTGTFRLLDESRAYYETLDPDAKQRFRFLHVSTDEVYGSLTSEAPAFQETSPYAPNSPYAASKAASDHLVRAYHHTYGLPTLTTNCSNNFGPYQYPEKLIPLMILNAVRGQTLPVYGDGSNVRDWLFVTDHCAGICEVLKVGRIGETYNIGGNSERTNIDVVKGICTILDNLLPDSPHAPHSQLITFVNDRPGHDQRYAMNIEKIERELGWRPAWSFEDGLRATVEWYLNHQPWINEVAGSRYRDWIGQQYGMGQKS